MTLVPRFGSALNLNVHFHMLFLDGVNLVDDLPDGTGQPVFRHVAGPGLNELQTLVEQIPSRIGRVLERRGLVERDIENAWLTGDGDGSPLDDLLRHSITYRIAVGPRAGQKLFTLQTVPARSPEQLDDPNGAARAGGFSLHAGIDIAPHQRPKLERLCRYVSRPPVGLKPEDIRYVIVSHGHNDHFGGAKHLQATYGARIVTPGHTTGTNSPIFEVRDGARRHYVGYWGGDGAVLKLPLLAARKAGEPHPFVTGNAQFRAWAGVLKSCAETFLPHD